LLLFSGIAAGQEKTAPAENRDPIRAILELVLKELKEKKLIASKSVCDRDAVADEECIVEMSVFEFNGHFYCIAKAPEVTVKRLPGTGKFVNWKLVPAVLTGDHGQQVLQFHSDAGIVTTYEKNGSQIDKKNRGHGRGNGPPQQHKFHVKTLMGAANGEAGYLPVVMWDRKGNGDLELCAAIDPKIVNEN
jgi:hypothetical protein